MAKPWKRVGTIRTSNGKSRMIFNQDVEVVVNGESVDLGQYRSTYFKPVSKMKEELEFLLDNGHINQEKYDKQMRLLEEKNVTHEVLIPQD